MSRGHDPLHERIDELLIDRAVLGIDEAAERELHQLDPRGATDAAHEFEAIAATAHLAFAAERPKALPRELRERLLAGIRGNAASRGTAQGRAPASWNAETAIADRSPIRIVSRRADVDEEPTTRLGGFFATLGWAVAAAAVLVLAFTTTSLNAPASRSGSGAVAVAPDVGPIKQRQQLIDNAADVVVTPWSATPDSSIAGISGDVVWSQSRQAGYLRIVGVPANTPTEAQYQLWIVDPVRDPKHPIDGGVFDIAATGETIVPIDAKLRIEQPTVFALTLEKPGGVVVSGGPLLAVAKL
ncbi:MAG: anti-sigma factor [Phycisphaerae bacterium]|nr:anti-sigma factor [Phycisphaerae bacterium]